MIILLNICIDKYIKISDENKEVLDETEILDPEEYEAGTQNHSLLGAGKWARAQ